MSKYFCSYPWEHIYVHTSGHVRLCCMSDQNITKDDGYYLYNLREDKITDTWNSQYMKKIRLDMINGGKPKTCYRCWQSLDQGLTALRKDTNKEYHITQTNSDGSVNYASNDLQLHFGNVCNLNCKMCSQMFSHSIGKELIKMGDADPDFLRWVKKESGVLNNWTGELDIVYDWFKNDKVKKSIFEHVSQNVDNFNVIGGEPTVIKEFFELLEYCYNQKTLENKTMGLVTNVTNINPRLTDWLSSLKNFTIFPSIDGIGDRQEYIRYPSNWNKIVENLNFYHSIIKNSRKGNLYFQPAIQTLNIDILDKMIDFFNSFEKAEITFIDYVQYPLICNYHFLPKGYKVQVAEKLYKIKDKHEKVYIKKELEAHAKNLVTNSIDDEQCKFLTKAFIKYNDFQDNFRKKKTWRQLMPDLETALTKSVG